MTFVITRPRPGPNNNTVCGKLQPPHTNRLKDSAGSAVRSLFLLGRTAPSAPRVRVRNQQQSITDQASWSRETGSWAAWRSISSQAEKAGWACRPATRRKGGVGNLRTWRFLRGDQEVETCSPIRRLRLFPLPRPHRPDRRPRSTEALNAASSLSLPALIDTVSLRA